MVSRARVRRDDRPRCLADHNPPHRPAVRPNHAERSLAQTEARNWKNVPYTGVTPGETPSWAIVQIG
jgi:hypothetical protein